MYVFQEYMKWLFKKIRVYTDIKITENGKMIAIHFFLFKNQTTKVIVFHYHEGASVAQCLTSLTDDHYPSPL